MREQPTVKWTLGAACAIVEAGRVDAQEGQAMRNRAVETAATKARSRPSPTGIGEGAGEDVAGPCVCSRASGLEVAGRGWRLLRERAGRVVDRKIRVCAHCGLWGGVYGAAYGAVVFGLGNPNIGPVTGAVTGTVVGAVYGAVAGFASGLIGDTIGRPLGWCFAGALGGAGPALMLWGATGEPIGYVFVALGLVPGILIGLGVGTGLRSAQPALPGVKRLGEIIRETSEPGRSRGPRANSAEVMPCMAPEGRGDEVVAAGGERAG